MNLRISSWSIRNPIPVLLIFALLTIAGIYSYARMPIKQFPNVAFPAVTVTIIQEGAAPTEMENQVTRLVENAISSVPNIDTMTSSVTLGASMTFIQFEIGSDIQKAKDDVEARVDQIINELPRDILPPRIAALDFTGMTLMSFAVSDPNMAPTELSWFIDNTVARRLQAVPGVGQVSRTGGANREINVTLDPVRMAALGVTAAQVNDTLRGFYRNYAGGRTEVGGADINTRVLGETETVAELENLTIPLRNGSYVRLIDVATVGDGAAEERSFARLNGRPVAGFNIVKVDKASEVTVEKGVLAEIAKLKAEHPGLEITKIYSMVDDTKANFHATEMVLIEGMILAALVVFIFLRDWRATLIAAVAMPLSLIPTFYVIALLGFSLNIITLLALTLVIGILVDDAIVEIENIQKRTLDGQTPFRAAMEGADAIGLAVVATTAAIAVVFLPVSFMGGFSGQFFVEFGITVAVSVIFSLLVARLVTPILAAYFLKPPKKLHDARALPGFYEASLRWALRHRLMSALIGGGMVVAAMAMTVLIPKSLIPTEDPGFLMYTIEAPPGTTREQMTAGVNQLNELITRQPDVQDVFISVGSGSMLGAAASAMSGGGGGAGMTSGNMVVVMREDRDLTTEDLKQRIAPQLKQIADIRLTPQTTNGPGGSDVQIVLTSDNGEALEAAQLALMADMRKLPEIRNVRLSPPPPGPELVIRPRTEEASRLGISTDMIAQVARIATTGDIDANTPKYSEGEQRLPIRIRLPETVRTDLQQLGELRIPARNGETTTLATVADLSYEAGPGVITRLDRRRMVQVEADLNAGVVSGTATAAVDATPTMQALPEGVTRTRLGNERAQAEMAIGMVVALLSGIALIYSVMVLLFRSVFKPITILASLPLCFSGGLLALMIVGMPISMPVMIGCILLLGIAAKNAILLVEFAIEAEARGASTYDALFEACRERARPIVMTTVAMIAGMIPIAIGVGEGAGFRQPMAVMVIGGLISSTILSLVLVPAIYSMVAGFERRINPLAAKLVTRRSEEDEELLRRGEI